MCESPIKDWFQVLLGHKWLTFFIKKQQPANKSMHLNDFKFLNSESDSGQFGENMLILAMNGFKCSFQLLVA